MMDSFHFRFIGILFCQMPKKHPLYCNNFLVDKTTWHIANLIGLEGNGYGPLKVLFTDTESHRVAGSMAESKISYLMNTSHRTYCLRCL
jgi:hypothetical protein